MRELEKSQRFLNVLKTITRWVEFLLFVIETSNHNKDVTSKFYLTVLIDNCGNILYDVLLILWMPVLHMFIVIIAIMETTPALWT